MEKTLRIADLAGTVFCAEVGGTVAQQLHLLILQGREGMCFCCCIYLRNFIMDARHETAIFDHDPNKNQASGKRQCILTSHENTKSQTGKHR